MALRRQRRDRGSAIVVAVIVIFIAIVFVQALLGVSEASLANVRRSVNRERSTAAADAGFRDAMMWLQGHSSQVSTQLANVGDYVCTPILSTGSASTQPSTASPSASYIRFGDSGNDSNGYPKVGYCYAIRNATSGGTSYYQIDVWGWAPSNSAPRTTTFTSNGFFADYNSTKTPTVTVLSTTPDVSQLDSVTQIEVIVAKNTSISSIPSAAIWGYSGSTPPTITTTGNATPLLTATHNNSNFNGNIATTGIDQGGSSNVQGLDIEAPNIGLNTGTTVVAGASSPSGVPPSFFGGNSGNAGPSTSTWSTLGAMVDEAAAATANPTGNPPFIKATYPSLPSGYVGNTSFTYVKIPGGSNVDTSIITTTGTPGATGGILILDIGDANGSPVTFGTGGIMSATPGNHHWDGTIILWQRGPIDLTGSNNMLVLQAMTGNQTQQIEFNSAKVSAAMGAFATYKVYAYMIKR